jgi:hypothetical protein
MLFVLALGNGKSKISKMLEAAVAQLVYGITGLTELADRYISSGHTVIELAKPYQFVLPVMSEYD